MIKEGSFLPQHQEEVEAIFALFPDRTSILSAANFSKNIDEGNAAAAASSGAAYAVLKISIPLVSTDSDGEKSFVVEAWLDDELLDQDYGEDCQPKERKASAETACIPALERTVSGRRLYCQFSVIELPPIELTIILPPDYPEYKAPDFVIFSPAFSNAQKTAMCKKLDQLATENAGLPVILTWIDWIQNECLKFLGIATNVVLAQEVGTEDADCRIGDADLSVLQRIQASIRHDIQAERTRFHSMDHECPICFDTLPGKDCFRVDACHHYGCRGCLAAYVEQSMQDGKIQGLKCAEDKCDEALPVSIIQALLSEEDWRRWESLAFSKALDTMSDLNWCPRCQMPVVCDEDHEKTLLAHCAYCYFAFCTRCKEAWHQGRQCLSLQEALDSLGDDKPTDKDEALCQKLLRKKLYVLSEIKIKQTTKPCPNCRAPIEKNYGCNKVTCMRCHTHMCYRCGKKIEDYEHFNSTNCPLMDATSDPAVADARPQPAINEAQLQMDVMLEVNPELRRRITRCPLCRQRNLKMDRNNHMRCWACSSAFCYQCHQRIVGTMKNHFGIGANRCIQHSDD